jgi:hypothetical protein
MEGFAHLNRAGKNEVFFHESANLLEHSPCSFVGHAALALNLLCRDTTTGCGHQVHRIEPEPQRRAGLLKYRPGHRGDVSSTVVAGVCFLRSNPVMFALHFAIRADRTTIGVSLLHQPVQACIIIKELLVEVVDSKAAIGRNGLRDFHGKISVPQILPYVKGYLPLTCAWLRLKLAFDEVHFGDRRKSCAFCHLNLCKPSEPRQRATDAHDEASHRAFDYLF